MRPLSSVFLALCSTVFCPLALAADGEAVGVDPSAVAQAQNVQRVLVHGSDISVGDRIITGPAGEVQILFSEGTRLVVGQLALDLAQYRSAGRPPWPAAGCRGPRSPLARNRDSQRGHAGSVAGRPASVEKCGSAFYSRTG